MTDFLLELITAALLLLGGLLMLIAAIGLVRLPDLLTRMHATTKAGTLGAALTIAAAAVNFADAAVTARAIAIILFLILTAPVAAHAIGRAGYFVCAPLWRGTIKDELRDRYDAESHVLHSGLPDNDKTDKR